MKKVVAIYRRHLQQCLQDEIKNPFLCLNIMCPAGSYDPNVEPAKDDVLFTAEDQVLEVLERFFQAVYGKAIEDLAPNQRTSLNDVSPMRLTPYAKPLVLLLQISNSTAVSDFSSETKLHEIARPEEVEFHQESNSASPATSSATILADRQSFIDISRPSPDVFSTAESDIQNLTDAEDSSQLVITDPWDAARISATQGRLRVEKGRQDVADILISTRERMQPLSHKVARSEQSSKSCFGEENAWRPSNLSTRPASLALNRAASGNGGRHNGSFSSTLYASTSKTAETMNSRGPLDIYFKSSTRNPIPDPPVNEALLSMGTPLSEIPTHTGRKRKAPSDNMIEISDPAFHTPTKHFNPSQAPAFTPPQPRLSLTPRFSHLPTNHNQPPATLLQRTGLITPETSPLKQQPLLIPSAAKPNIYLSQNKPQIQTPPSLTKKPTLKKQNQHISPTTTKNVKTSFTILAKHDTYTAGKLDKQTTAFDLSSLPDDKADRAVRGCYCVVEELISVKDDGKTSKGVGGVRRGYDVDAGMEFEFGDEVGFA